MDTDIFDTEISLTFVTKVFIELLTSRIHRNMIRKLRSINSKSVQLLILALSLLAVIFAAQQQQAQARTWFDVGYEDGRNDARNGVDNNVCPSELDNNDSGCALYRSGYTSGHAVRGLLHPEDNNGGTTEDDGEFVPNDDD
jgi:hypothetical protein